MMILLLMTRIDGLFLLRRKPEIRHRVMLAHFHLAKTANAVVLTRSDNATAQTDEMNGEASPSNSTTRRPYIPEC
jgi:hypothetical protein